MIAISGYTGFVGRHLVSSLQSESCLLLGRINDERAEHAQAEHKQTKPNLAYHNHVHTDLTLLAVADERHLNQLVRNLKGVDTLVHLAAKVHQMPNKKNVTEGVTTDSVKREHSETFDYSDDEYLKMNATATVNLAKCAIKAGVKRFIFLSTIKVNGEHTPIHSPFTQADTPNPGDPYSRSKLVAETQLQELAAQTQLELVIIRPPLVYGEGVKANFAALMNFAKKRRVNPFVMINDNRRSFVSVYNLCSLIRRCINYSPAKAEIFLVSDGDDVSTSELMKLAARAQNVRLFPIPIPKQAFAIVAKIFNKKMQVARLTSSLRVDITHTQSNLNWSPPYSLEEGFQLISSPTVKHGYEPTTE